MIRNNKTYVLHVLLSSFHLLAHFHTVNERGRWLTCSYYELFMCFSLSILLHLHTQGSEDGVNVSGQTVTFTGVSSSFNVRCSDTLMRVCGTVSVLAEQIRRNHNESLRSSLRVRWFYLIMRVSAQKRDKRYLKESLPTTYKSIMFFFFLTIMCKPINHLSYATLLIH